MASDREKEFINKAKNFDLQILGEIYDSYSPELYRYAMRLLGNECLAEDCVADTFSRFLQTLRTHRGPDHHLKAYLYRIAHNWITDYYRRNSPSFTELNETIEAGDHERVELLSEINLERQHLRLALRTLTPNQRQVIVLKFIEEWKNEEIAAALELPVGAIKALQHRAIASMQKRLIEMEKAGRP